MDFGALLLPAALLFGAPTATGSYEKGLFCESVQLIERVVERADRGADPLQAVANINRTLNRRACLYSRRLEVRARTVKFERTIAAHHAVYSIYRVDVTAFAPARTEIGKLIWELPRPLTMYTIRQARPEQFYDH